MRVIRKTAVFLLLLLPALLVGATFRADEPAAASEKPAATVGDTTARPPAPATAEAAPAPSDLFERVRVLGTPEAADKIPGSVAYLDQERLARQQYEDVHRVLSQVAGVSVQEEDGYGLRPNIGMRGTGTERSSKITVMEDGVLIAPAPYAAPAAYYFPTIGRMEGVEVRKGSSSIRQGPFTNGGVLNFISSSIPTRFGGSADLALGDNGTTRGRAKLGGAGERHGWLVETYQMDTDGFKQLDGGGDTGFDLRDYLLKLRLNTAAGARMFQALEIKAGHTEQDGHETYLGLTEEDFQRSPFRRYAASRQDRFDSDHDQLQARYLLRPNEYVDFTATVYRNDFFRNWRKLEKVSGRSIADVLADPARFADELAILRGDLDQDSDADVLTLRNNRRDYYAHGVQAVVGVKTGGSASRHELELGLRLHEDAEDRFQEEDGYAMSAGGRMLLTSTGEPGSQSNRVSSADSLALFVQDSISLGKLTLVPGVRFESMRFERVDFADASRQVVSGRRLNELDEVIPGIGINYELTRRSSLFGGVHRGFSPPGPGSTDAEPEESVNWELGVRHVRGWLKTQIVGFYNDYVNLLGACTVASGCSSAEVGDVFDGGQVEVRGLEVSLSADPGMARGARFRLPIELAYTYTRGEFLTDFQSSYDPWGAVERGDGLPYLPAHQVSLGVGLVHERWSTHANALFVDRMRTVAGQGPIPRAESTDAHLLVDVAASYGVGPRLRLFVQLRNVTDEVYVAARQPAGVRPGIGRTALGGIALSF